MRKYFNITSPIIKRDWKQLWRLNDLTKVEKWVKDHQDMEGRVDAQELMEFLDSLR